MHPNLGGSGGRLEAFGTPSAIKERHRRDLQTAPARRGRLRRRARRRDSRQPSGDGRRAWEYSLDGRTPRRRQAAPAAVHGGKPGISNVLGRLDVVRRPRGDQRAGELAGTQANRRSLARSSTEARRPGRVVPPGRAGSQSVRPHFVHKQTPERGLEGAGGPSGSGVCATGVSESPSGGASLVDRSGILMNGGFAIGGSPDVIWSAQAGKPGGKPNVRG